MFGGGDCIAIVSVHNLKFYVFSRETISAINFSGLPYWTKAEIGSTIVVVA